MQALIFRTIAAQSIIPLYPIKNLKQPFWRLLRLLIRMVRIPLLITHKKTGLILRGEKAIASIDVFLPGAVSVKISVEYYLFYF